MAETKTFNQGLYGYNLKYFTSKDGGFKNQGEVEEALAGHKTKGTLVERVFTHQRKDGRTGTVNIKNRFVLFPDGSYKARIEWDAPVSDTALLGPGASFERIAFSQKIHESPGYSAIKKIEKSKKAPYVFEREQKLPQFEKGTKYPYSSSDPLADPVMLWQQVCGIAGTLASFNPYGPGM